MEDRVARFVLRGSDQDGWRVLKTGEQALPSTSATQHDHLVGLTALDDGTVVAGSKHGVLMAVRLDEQGDFLLQDTLKVEDHTASGLPALVSNSLSSQGQAVFLVTHRELVRVDLEPATRRFSLKWARAYHDRDMPWYVGRLGAGSGSTPTVTECGGRSLVVITDGALPMDLLWYDAETGTLTGRRMVQFGADEEGNVPTTSEQSVAVAGAYIYIMRACNDGHRTPCVLKTSQISNHTKTLRVQGLRRPELHGHRRARPQHHLRVRPAAPQPPPAAPRELLPEPPGPQQPRGPLSRARLPRRPRLLRLRRGGLRTATPSGDSELYHVAGEARVGPRGRELRDLHPPRLDAPGVGHRVLLGAEAGEVRGWVLVGFCWMRWKRDGNIYIHGAHASLCIDAHSNQWALLGMDLETGQDRAHLQFYERNLALNALANPVMSGFVGAADGGRRRQAWLPGHLCTQNKP